MSPHPRSRPHLRALVLALLALLALPWVVSANHQWSTYHWERPSASELVLNIGDCHTQSSQNWSNLLTDIVANWDNIPDNDTTYNSAYIGFSKANCTGGNIKSYNDNYGDSGWLGLASIWVTRGKDKHITQGESKVNEYYVTLQGYDGFNEEVEWRHVLCQEIGHTFGLDHNREGADGGSPDDTCMNDQTRPLRYPTPNVHDHDQLNIMYAHDHAGGGGGGGGGGNGGPPCPPKCGGNKASAVWAEHYDSVDAMAAAADAIVVARVQRTLPAPAIGNVPFTLVRFAVEQVVKGDARLARGFTLRQTGGDDFFIEDDPPYTAGERYTLYLRAVNNGLYRTVSPQGRTAHP